MTDHRSPLRPVTVGDVLGRLGSVLGHVAVADAHADQLSADEAKLRRERAESVNAESGDGSVETYESEANRP